MKFKKLIACVLACSLAAGGLYAYPQIRDVEMSTSYAETRGYYGLLEYGVYNETRDDYDNFIPCDPYIYINYCDDSATEIEIPAEINGIPVIGISYKAFKDCTSLNSVTIPDSVTDISESAFEGCTSLKSIIIPDGVTYIGSGAFRNCTSLESITIPDSVRVVYKDSFLNTPWYKAQLKKSPLVIAGAALIDGTACEGDVTIPDGVKYISFKAFMDCTSLESITIPDGVTTIGFRAFYGCKNLKSISIPDSVIEINSSAFKDCTSLESITIPDGVTTIGFELFDGCKNLKSIFIPDSVMDINGSAFYGCSEDLVISGYVPSYAKRFAKENNITFQEVERPAPVTTEPVDPYEPDEPDDPYDPYEPDEPDEPYEPEEPYPDFPQPDHELAPGDIDGDGSVTASDASFVLMQYAALSTGAAPPFNSFQDAAGDINGDGSVDASDASLILQFYAYLSTGGKLTDMKEWFLTEVNPS